MKKLLLLLLVIGIAAGAAPLSAAEFKPKAEYRCHSPATDATVWTEALKMFVKNVNERTGLNLKVYHSSQLISGKQASEFQFMKNGTTDFAFTGVGNYATSVPATNLFTLPWFLSAYPDKYKAMDAICYGESGRMLADVLEKEGIVVLGWGESGYRELHYGGNRPPVLKPEDIKGMKVRYVASPLYHDTYAQLGANPVAINWNEAMTAFQQGVVDGGDNTWSIIINNRLYDFHKQITEWSYASLPCYFTVNAKVWNTFPEDVREIMRECAYEAGRWSMAASRIGVDDGWSRQYLEEKGMYPPDRTLVPSDEPYKFLEEKGVVIHKLTPEQIKPWRDAVQPVYDKWIPRIGKELVEQAVKDMEAAFPK